MDALRLGPLVLSAPRLFAGLGLALLVLSAEFVARRATRQGKAGTATDASWAWNAAGAAVLGARIGFVLENLPYFRNAPAEALMIWQGGFSPWWGIGAGVAVAALTLRSNWRAALVPGIIALAGWALLPALLTPATTTERRLPDLTIPTLAGEAVALRGHVGRPVVLNVWATWCLPCRREIPQLARAAELHPEVTFLFVNQGEQRAAVQSFLSDQRLFPGGVALPEGAVLLDGSGAVSTALGGVGLPTTYFFGPSGTLEGVHVGEISGAALSLWSGRLNAMYSQISPLPEP